MKNTMFLVLLSVLFVGLGFAVSLPLPSSSVPTLSGTVAPASLGPDCRIQTC